MPNFVWLLPMILRSRVCYKSNDEVISRTKGNFSTCFTHFPNCPYKVQSVFTFHLLANT